MIYLVKQGELVGLIEDDGQALMLDELPYDQQLRIKEEWQGIRIKLQGNKIDFTKSN